MKKFEQALLDNRKEITELIKDLADLGHAIEDVGNECFLCSYQPAKGRRIQQKKIGYRPPYASPPKQKEIKNNAYPHEGKEDCLIYKAMILVDKLILK